jgi:copper chaperone CopZ
MKSLHYILFFLTLSLISCKTETSVKTETFKVWGNCEKCKVTIENSCIADGIIEKNWNIESTLMTVKFDTTKITLDHIQQLIANSGYDNDGYYGDDYAYGKLAACCQYERKPFELK